MKPNQKADLDAAHELKIALLTATADFFNKDKTGLVAFNWPVIFLALGELLGDFIALAVHQNPATRTASTVDEAINVTAAHARDTANERLKHPDNFPKPATVQ